MPEELQVYWKRVWQIVSGHITNVTRKEVHEQFFKSKNELLSGILYYTETTDTASKKKWPDDVEKFLKRASGYLNVDMDIGWEILRSYVVYDFYGSIKSIQKLKYEMQILPMLNHIWKFYTSERMFKLKILKVAIEFMKDDEHHFSDIYKAFIENLGFTNLWKSFVNQFKYLITEMNGNTVNTNCPLELWIERNLREQVEILQCLIILVEYSNVTIEDFRDLLVLFKIHGFGREPCYFNSVAVPDVSLTCNLRYAEIALLLCVANHLWSGTSDWYGNSNIINNEITPLTYHEEHGAVIYIWVILHMILPNADELFSGHFHKLTEIALNLNVFDFFYRIASNEMFEPNYLLGNNVQEALYNMLYITCNKFDSDGSLFNYNGVVPLTATLLKNKFLSERLYKENDAGVISLWNTAVELFPFDPVSLSILAEAVITSNYSLLPKVMEELNVLPVYTEIYKTNIAHTLRRQQYDTIVVLQEYQPEMLGTFIIPVNTEAVVASRGERTLIHFKVEYSYWFVVNAMIRSALQQTTPTHENLTSITTALKLVVAIFKVQTNNIKIYPYLREIIDLTFSLLNKHKEVDMVALPFFGVCMDLCSELIQSYRQYVISSLETVNIFPSIIKNEFELEEIFKLNFLNPGLIGKLIVQTEKNNEQQMLLISYLNLLRSSYKFSKNNLSVIELPGLVFLLKEIFPHFMFWYSKQEHILHDVLYHCIHFIFELFQLSEEKLKLKIFIQMRKITFLCFLNENCGRCLLQVLSIGNSGIMQIMESQTNWQAGRGIRYISVLQKVMSILMQLLTLRRSVTNITTFTPLEHLIYTENDNIRSVKAVASYLNHPFNEVIPNLACRLLKKLTIKLQMSMLASLELEPDQVRVMFMQRLRDHLECDELKLAIIELITACIPKQSGMTEAFFKVSEPSLATFSKQSNTSISSNDSSLDEGIGTFLVEYLMKFNSGDSQVHMSLISRIMELLCVLWINQKEILIADLVKDEQFWPSLCHPMVNETPFSNKTYSEILNIIAKEIHKKAGNVDKPLLDILSVLLSPDQPHLERWINYIFYSRHTEMNKIDKTFSEEPAMSALVVSWKDLLIIAAKLLPSSYFPPEVQVKLTAACRNALTQQILYLENNSIMTYLAELYLFFISNWGDTCIKDNNEVYVDITNILQKVALTYQDLSKRFKESIMAITILMLYRIKSPSALNSRLAKSLIESVVKMFDHEYEFLTYQYDNKLIDTWYSQNKEHNSFIMCFAALNKLINLESTYRSTEYNAWLAQMQIVGKLINCIRRFLKQPCTLPLAKIAMELLIYYAKSNNSNDFLNVDISVLLLEDLVPPKDYRQPNYMANIQTLPWSLKAWWTVYRRVLMLLNVLLKKHTYLILKDILMFVSLHKEYIVEILLIQRYSVDGIVLDLTTTTLCFLHELLKYSNRWRDDHEESFLTIFDGIKMAINCSSAVIIRPNVLRYFVINASGRLETPSFESVPTEAIVEVVDKLTDIFILGTRCILQFSPPLYNMLRDSTDYTNWNLQIGTNFGIPKLGVDESSELTFGSLICVSCLYVRVLQQIMNIKRPTMLSPNREILVPRKTRLSQSSASKSDDPKSTKSNTSVSNEEKSLHKSMSEHDADSKSEECLNEIKKSSAKPTRETVLGFIRLDYFNPVSNINFATYATPVRGSPWFMNLNEERAMNALEVVLTLLASQACLITIHKDVEKRIRRYFRRELCSELQIFHEFIKKRLTDSYRYSVSDKTCFLRRKLGSIENEKTDEHDSKKDSIARKIHFTNDADKVQSSRGHSSKRSMEPDIFEGTPSSSTPKVNSPSESDATGKVSRQMKSTSKLFEAKLTSEDYLQLLSFWFMYVIRTHK